MIIAETESLTKFTAKSVMMGTKTMGTDVARHAKYKLAGTAVWMQEIEASAREEQRQGSAAMGSPRTMRAAMTASP